MTSDNLQLICSIHATQTPVVVAVTGGGTTALGELLSQPGGSKTLLDAQIPYSPQALAAWLGAAPDQACSERTSRAMAMMAYMRARQLSGQQARSAGIAVTASLATNRLKRGAHRIHAAYQNRSTTCSLSLVLHKQERSRAEEERLAANLLLYAIGEATGVTAYPPLPLLAGEKLVRRQVDGHSDWQRLLAGEQEYVAVSCRGATDSIALYPGAFNPIHSGHVEIAELAEQLIDCHVLFELSIANVDKPPLDYIEIEARAAQFEGRPLLLTRAATFIEKARLFPHTPFVVGADTMARIGDARYYDNNPRLRDAAIAELHDLGSSFLVFGRQIDGEYRTLDMLGLPSSLRDLAMPVPEAVFRRDLSSTDLRNENTTIPR